jgi:hypothetical protein
MNVKFLLLCFELLSGLKINFLKSEVIVMGAEQDEQARVANALNCRVGSFPLTYLGFPISDRKLTIADMANLVNVVGRRVEPWQGRFMSSAARLILTNSSLSSLPIYSMGLFLLSEGTHAGFDSHLARFFWEGTGEKRKFHWVKWPDVCRPKDQGGLGVLNSRFLNIALMTKWIWRLYNEDEGQCLWLKLLRAKYPGATNIFSSSPSGGSPFWHQLHKIKHFFKLGAKFILGNGQNILFWTDWWSGESPLCERFHTLFDICSYPAMTVATASRGTTWHIPFRRTFGPLETEQWNVLLAELAQAAPSVLRDKVSWALEPSGGFSTSSLYRKLCQGEACSYANDIWSANIPLKVKIFTWQLARNRLPTNEQLARRHGPSNGQCVLCGLPESADHLFFSCHLAKFLWSGVRSMLAVQWNPTSFPQFFDILNLFSGKARRFIWLLFAAQSWALWNIRNKFSIEGTFPKQPADCVFKTTILLQQWRPLARSKDVELVDGLISLMKTLFLNTYNPAAAHV